MWQKIVLAVIPTLVALASVPLAFPALLATGAAATLVSIRVSNLLATAGAGGRLKQTETSIRDLATGLLSPWYFELRVEEEAERCRRYGRSMAVIVFKILLRDREISMDWRSESAEAAQLCISVVRSVDLSSMLGPFEFAVCLVETGQTGAQAVQQRVAQQLAEYECLAGFAVYPSDSLAASGLIRVARDRCDYVQAA